MAEQKVATAYNTQALLYEDYVVNTPAGRLETELYLTALGDPTGLRILDLGGGTGVRARQAVERGAQSVDVVDLSAEMMQIGQDEAERVGLGDRIRWFQADVSRPLSGEKSNGAVAPLRFEEDKKGTYDVVQANWVFDHASSPEALEGMWANAVGYLRPGGRFISVFVPEPQKAALVVSKYGTKLEDFHDIPGGLRYRCTLYSDPPMVFEGHSMQVMSSGSSEMFEKFGLEDIRVLLAEDTTVVKSDPEFWKEAVQNPIMRFVVARKTG